VVVTVESWPNFMSAADQCVVSAKYRIHYVEPRAKETSPWCEAVQAMHKKA
jgi:hypothetical protein